CAFCGHYLSEVLVPQSSVDKPSKAFNGAVTTEGRFQSGKRPSVFQSLKVVVSKCAIKLSLPEAAPLKTGVLTCTDTGRCDRVFRLVLFRCGPFSGRA